MGEFRRRRHRQQDTHHNSNHNHGSSSSLLHHFLWAPRNMNSIHNYSAMPLPWIPDSNDRSYLSPYLLSDIQDPGFTSLSQPASATTSDDLSIAFTDQRNCSSLIHFANSPAGSINEPWPQDTMDQGSDCLASTAAAAGSRLQQHQQQQHHQQQQQQYQARKSTKKLPRLRDRATSTKKRGQRRVRHNDVEKKYRDRLNDYFEQLIAALEDSEGKDRCALWTKAGMGSLTKASVLDLAQQRILDLNSQNRLLRHKVEQSISDHPDAIIRGAAEVDGAHHVNGGCCFYSIECPEWNTLLPVPPMTLHLD